nr:MAG TPA: hypothetical protein [Bacteriophage sp.]
MPTPINIAPCLPKLEPVLIGQVHNSTLLY